jgi:hypothetical protein
MHRLFVRLLLIAMVWLTPAAASAICFVLPPLCQAYDRYDAIFDGTVTAIERLDLPSDAPYARNGRIGHRLVTFRVHDAWKGVETETVQLLLSGGYEVVIFESFHAAMGARYVIFAHRGRSGYLSTSDCTHSQQYADASESLAFLDSLRKPATGGRVYGNVVKHQAQSSFGPPGPVPLDARVILSGGGLSWETTTKEGRFDFRNLPPGDYLLTAAPSEALVGSTTRRFTLDSPRSCGKVEFYFAIDTELRGRLISTGGTPISLHGVDVVPAERWHERPLPRMETTTDPKGAFRIAGIEPGRYIVGVNLRDVLDDFEQFPRTMYGGDDPEIITVGAGDRHDLGTLTLKRSLQKPEFSVRLQWDDGRPASAADVWIEDATGGWVDGQDRLVSAGITDRRGAFTFTGRQGRNYVATIRARPRDPRSVITRSEPFSTDQEKAAVEVLLPRPMR